MLKIIVENVIYSSVKKSNIAVVKPALQAIYKRAKYDPTTRKSIYIDHSENLISSKGIFLTGYLPRLKKYLSDKNIPYEIENHAERLKQISQPTIQNKTLRDDQQRLVDQAIKNQRGILIAPTGSGKTLLAGAIISCFPKKKALFLCDKKSLAYQAAEDFKEYGLKNITVVGDGQKDTSGNIVVAIQKSLISLDLKSLSTQFDIIILDESHGLSDRNSQHAEILRSLLAPIRIGLTATYPSDQRVQLVMEGLLGPIVGELTAAEAKAKNIVADIKVVIRKVEFDQAIRDLRRYADVYSQGIVNNILFNRMIIREAKYWISQGQIVLIYFNIVDQGKFLKKIADELGVEAELIHGETKNNDRESTKQLLKSRELKCVIASKIWNTGVNIPPLSVIINAAGGKSDIMIRQLAGRGTRVCEGKDKMIFVDFFNPNSNYFISHFGHRLSQFCDLGWI